MTEKPTYAVGLDAGSRTTRVAICVLERGRLRFLGAGSGPSEGWLKSRIANQTAVAESVRMAVAEAQASRRREPGIGGGGDGRPDRRRGQQPGRVGTRSRARDRTATMWTVW